MKRISLKSQVVFCLMLIGIAINAAAQEKKTIRIGVNYGTGAQSDFPWANTNYFYAHRYVKFQINYVWKRRGNWQYELNFEPTFYSSQHQLLNLYYIQPERGPDYLAQRERFTKLTSFNEYTLNVGFIPRYYITKSLSAYAIASIGPMITGNDTERLKKGFAFSDIIGLGVSFEFKRLRLDARGSLRHASNAGFSEPNDGHNSACLEGGFSIKL